MREINLTSMKRVSNGRAINLTERLKNDALFVYDKETVMKLSLNARHEIRIIDKEILTAHVLPSIRK